MARGAYKIPRRENVQLAKPDDELAENQPDKKAAIPKTRRKRATGNIAHPLIWTITSAAKEFRIDVDTLEKQMKAAGFEAFGRTFTSQEIVSAYFGNYEYERTRKVRLDADLAQIEKDKAQDRLVDKEEYVNKFSRFLSIVRQVVSNAVIPEFEKGEMLKQILHSSEGLDK